MKETKLTIWNDLLGIISQHGIAAAAVQLNSLEVGRGMTGFNP